MPEEEPELSEAEASELVQRIEAGEDGIAVPAELLEEPEERPAPPPRNLYARILRMKIAEKLKLALRGNRGAEAGGDARRARSPADRQVEERAGGDRGAGAADSADDEGAEVR